MTLSSLMHTLSGLILNSAGIINHQQGKPITAFQELGELSQHVLDLWVKVAEEEGRIQSAKEEMEHLHEFV